MRMEHADDDDDEDGGVDDDVSDYESQPMSLSAKTPSRDTM